MANCDQVCVKFVKRWGAYSNYNDSTLDKIFEKTLNWLSTFAKIFNIL